MECQLKIGWEGMGVTQPLVQLDTRRFDHARPLLGLVLYKAGKVSAAAAHGLRPRGR